MFTTDTYGRFPFSLNGISGTIERLRNTKAVNLYIADRMTGALRLQGMHSSFEEARSLVESWIDPRAAA